MDTHHRRLKDLFRFAAGLADAPNEQRNADLPLAVRLNLGLLNATSRLGEATRTDAFSERRQGGGDDVSRSGSLGLVSPSPVSVHICESNRLGCGCKFLGKRIRPYVFHGQRAGILVSLRLPKPPTRGQEKMLGRPARQICQSCPAPLRSPPHQSCSFCSLPRISERSQQLTE